MNKSINFEEMLSQSSSDISNDSILNQLLNKSSPFREKIINYATMPESKWADIDSVISIDGQSFQLEPDEEKLMLRNAPGDIDYNIFYQDGSTYQEPVKAGILLDCLRERFTPTERIYTFLFKHILMKYHTYAGTNNDIFRQIIASELHEFEMSAFVQTEYLNDFLNLFEIKWKEHLQQLHDNAIAAGEKPVDIIILTSDGGTAHRVVCETLKIGLLAQGKQVLTINESQELGPDPLLTIIGISRSHTFSKIKQQAGDEELYKALTILNNRIAPFVKDQRMEVLRRKTILCSNIVSLNTFAHDSRLAADGKAVIFDVFDTGLINAKLIQIARHRIKYAMPSINFLIHPPGALIKNNQGYPVPIHESPGFHMTQYAVQPIQQRSFETFKSDTKLLGERLSVLTFGGQGCAGKASVFLKILASNELYPEQPSQHRDIVLLAGTGYRTVMQEMISLFQLDTNKVIEEQLNYDDYEFKACRVAYNAQKTIHVWSNVSQQVMHALSQSSDHFILKPGASSAAEAFTRQARGLVVYYDASHPWEKGNAQLLTNSGAGIIYDRTPFEKCCSILKHYEHMMLNVDPGLLQYPTAVDTVVNLLDEKNSYKLNQVSPPLINSFVDNNQDIYSRGISCAAQRIMGAQIGNLKKDPDRIIALRPNITQTQIEIFFIRVIDLLKEMPPDAIDSIGSTTENPSIAAFINLLQEAERELLVVDRSVSIQTGHIQDKPIIIWTGFAAMDASIRDLEGICNFDIPILNMLFVVWEEIFCHPASLDRSEILSKIPPEYPMSLLGEHPVVKQLQQSIEEECRKNPSISTEEITQKYFGSELNHADNLFAEKMGTLVSRVFIKEFHQHSSPPIVYFSINKIKEFDKPVLAINTISWDYELPLLHNLGNQTQIRFKTVTNDGLVKEVPIDQIHLARNRFFKESPLQDRRFYTCGMPGFAEWLVYSLQPSRPTISVSKIRDIINKWYLLAMKHDLVKNRTITSDALNLKR